MSILKSLSSTVVEILKGNLKFWGVPLAQGHVQFFSMWNFMTGLGKPRFMPNLKSLASAIAEIIKRNPEFWETPLAQVHFPSGWNFMVILGKPQMPATFEVAGFICYGNIRGLVVNIRINQNREPLSFWRNWLYYWICSPDVLYSVYNFCGAVTAVNGWFFAKRRILQWKILNLGARGGVENVWTKVLNGIPLRQIWSNKSFGVCASRGVLTLYRAEKAHWKFESSITLRRYSASVKCYNNWHPYPDSRPIIDVSKL